MVEFALLTMTLAPIILGVKFGPESLVKPKITPFSKGR